MPKRRLVTIVIFSAFVVMGISSSILGPTLANLAGALSIPLASAGILRATQQIGAFAVSLSLGRVLDRHSTRLILLPGVLLMAVGLVGLSASTSMVSGLFMSLLLGAGTGFLNLGANVTIGFLYESRASSVLAALHTCFGLGLFGGPLIAGLVMVRPDGWRLAYVVPAVLCVGLSLLFSRESMSVKLRVVPTGKQQARVSIPWLMLAPLILILFTYNGAGNAFADWIATHLRLAASASVYTAAQVTSLYGLSLTIGRGISIGALRKFGNMAVLAVALGLATIGSALIVFVGSQVALVAVGIVLVGLGFAPLYPTVIAMGGQLQPEIRGMVTGIMAGIASMGGMIIPFVQGQVGGGHSGGMIVTLIASLVMIVGLVMIRLIGPRRLVQAGAGS